MTEPNPAMKKPIKWPLLILSSFLLAVGTIGGPLLSRLYYLYGGKLVWVATCMEVAGFPVIVLPLIVLFSRSFRSPSSFFMEPKLFAFSAIMGIFLGLVNFLYAVGISYIPASTSSLLYSTQLVFIAFFAWIIVKQKFTAFSINSVVQMTLGAVLLGLAANSDRPKGVTNVQYFVGFFLTLLSAALLGLTWPLVELCYACSTRKINYKMVMQFQLNLGFFATIFTLTGMLINKDFQAMGKEAKDFELGRTMYYLVLIVGAVVWQCSFMGSLGVILCTSSLFNGIMSAVLLPFAEVAAVVAYHESFNGEKAMSLVLCMWGFISYFYGEYKAKKKANDAINDEEVVDLL